MVEDLQPKVILPASNTEAIHIRDRIWTQVWLILRLCHCPSQPLIDICFSLGDIWITRITRWRNTNHAFFSTCSVLWMERKFQCANGQMELLSSAPSLKKLEVFQLWPSAFHYGRSSTFGKLSLLWDYEEKGKELSDLEGMGLRLPLGAPAPRLSLRAERLEEDGNDASLVT